ncbi:prepilin peptidase [Pseudoclavibacter chungangensis]|uniref:Prepilin peptidase n=1 Tax=Pseudoclavibacter chungangensis TaxID=587635 RepID=A0A7J5BSA1_9MICO|nr:A24 family peptidase [Pseudoclavibacter chungangensis]KAB1655614.1 prepilin peptidase [Pseudoclavibacter chungangensis]NYJ67988.1 leader peptidase (prepilin peptidase)/N-methyltransferase [Pseudoclavibacter chungangensis]
MSEGHADDRTDAGRAVRPKRLAPAVAAATVLALLVGTVGTAAIGPEGIAIVRVTALAVVGAGLALVDARTRRLPDLCTLPTIAALLALDTASAWIAAPDGGSATPTSAAGSALLLGCAAAAAAGGGFFVLAVLGTMGGGDVKLAALVGVALVPATGWGSLATAVVAAYLLALPHAVVSSVRRRRGARAAEHLPFGPYLIAGAAVAWLGHTAGLVA